MPSRSAQFTLWFSKILIGWIPLQHQQHRLRSCWLQWCCWLDWLFVCDSIVVEASNLLTKTIATSPTAHNWHRDTECSTLLVANVGHSVSQCQLWDVNEVAIVFVGKLLASINNRVEHKQSVNSAMSLSPFILCKSHRVKIRVTLKWLDTWRFK